MKLNELSGGKTLVHCQWGKSRSVSICVAYLIRYNRMTAEESVQMIKNIRPIAQPNKTFLQQLLRFHTYCNKSSDKDNCDEQVTDRDCTEQQEALNLIHKLFHLLQLQLSCSIK